MPKPRLRERYEQEVAPALVTEFGYRNPLEVPRLWKVTVNVGLGEATQNAKAVEACVHDIASITGQRPVVSRARKSIAGFKLRKGVPIGVMATLRGERMYYFVDKLFNVALARLRDFRGLPERSFDGRGNYSLGLREQVVFPEIEYDKIDRIRGLEVTIVTTARTDEEAKRLLQLLGLPMRG
ncbi:MAG: 50S ribosomal protein L5 [Chloroflexi bacterium]|nr:50S ribosomal protein L5 [Chloroflexota bacterium]